jgi:hypothetical protein
MRDMVLRRWCWWWVMMDLVKRSFVPLLLLSKNIESVLHLCDPRSLPIDILHVSFGVFDYSLSSQDGFLFLPDPLNFLLDSGQFLLFFCCFNFLGLFVPIKDLDLVKLCVPMDHLHWQRCPWG